MSCSPSSVAMQRNPEQHSDVALQLKFFKVFYALSGWLNLRNYSQFRNIIELPWRTLTTRVRIAATTSSDPSSMRLPGNSGSYSQIALAFSMAAIFVIWAMTATLARFTMCSRHLYNNVKLLSPKKYITRTHTYGSWFSVALHCSCRRLCWCSIVLQLMLLFEALSSVTLWSCKLTVINNFIKHSLTTHLGMLFTHNPHTIAKTNEVLP